MPRVGNPKHYKAGCVINPLTGRAIKTGGTTYHKLRTTGMLNKKVNAAKIAVNKAIKKRGKTAGNGRRRKK